MNIHLKFFKEKEKRSWETLDVIIKMYGVDSREAEVQRAIWHVYHELVQVYSWK